MIRHAVERYFNRRWYEGSGSHWLWSPLSRWVTRIARRRREEFLEEAGRPLFESSSSTVPPVLVVGNITVGGTGKTPLVIYLIEHLRGCGLKLAVISRGYGGKAANYPLLVTDQVTPEEAGDEPAMIYQRTGITLVVDPRRRRALQWLAEQGDYDLVISDDGLQHYDLPRHYEIAVIDGERGLGNGACLPAGPLREPRERLESVDAIVVNGAPGERLTSQLREVATPVYTMEFQPQGFISLLGEPRALDGFTAQEKASMEAIAAIGNPQRFFRTLTGLGLDPKTRPFPDHYGFSSGDFSATGQSLLLMTEKDAVKVKGVLSPKRKRYAYYLAITAVLSGDLINDIITRFKGETRNVRI
ncbi:MAG: tetraacyldisaccharide 4'-kinase [Ketobacteraceae bacterium]|nr:tetraacyldisaccharide 4'-kinase [Ketobacteraceae bacterium]